MESTTKIHLSALEAELINNTEWILTKHRVTKKVYQMFGHLNELMKKELISFNHLPVYIQKSGGKISRGENYRLLPYIILDYPYFFSKNNIFAVRTMFWWGNFFSITLHLSGDHKLKFISNKPALHELLKMNDFFIGVSHDEWQHHFEEGNYRPATDCTKIEFDNTIRQPFFKVAKKISLKQWDNTECFVINTFKEILELLQVNFQDDRKDLLPGFPTTGSDL